MDNKTAKALIIGVIIAIAVGYFTSDVKYYFKEEEIKKSSYEYRHRNSNREYLDKSYHFKTIFVLLGFLGGFGAGYLLSDKIPPKEESK